MKYKEFLKTKEHISGNYGFDPLFLPDCLFDFQKMLVEWSIKKGRSAIFADCGLGKSLMQLVWSENIYRHTNKNILILAPLAVTSQMVLEGEKFGIKCHISRDGKVSKGITVTNYEKLHLFNWGDFIGCVCDESSILKNFDGQTKEDITCFMKKLPYRLLCTATASPNDYIELGTSSEALGYLGYIDMLKMFFKSDDGSYAQGGTNHTRYSGSKSFGGKFRFRGHSEDNFWKWVCSWARAVRKPSDLGFSDEGFILPKLETIQHTIEAKVKRDGWLFDIPAVGLSEQREERRRTINERCEKAASLVVEKNDYSVSWCHLNDEGNLLKHLIPDSEQISGSDKDERKVELFNAFSSGELKNLITKPKIAGFGLNWQHCNYQTFFPSHSFEQWYQSIRRCWRFGQKRNVLIDIVTSEGEADILKNLKRKSTQAEVMFEQLVLNMNDQLVLNKENEYTKKEESPKWL